MNDHNAPPEDFLRRYLDEEEELLWCARPKPGIRVRGADWFSVFFGGMMLLFMLIWLGTMITLFVSGTMAPENAASPAPSGMAAAEAGGSAATDKGDIPEDRNPPPLPVLIFMCLFILPFLAFAGYMAFGRFWFEARKRARSVYGLTRDRLLVVSGGWKRTFKSYDLSSMTDLSLEERRDGSGDITFGPANPMAQWFGGFGSFPGMQSSPALESVPEVSKLFRLIQQQRRAGAC